jgi:hypothetical protein
VQCSEGLRRGGLDVLRQAEPGSLRDGDGTESPGPVVDVAEDPAMDRAQVLQVKAGHDRRFLKEDQRCVGDLPLRGL